MSDAKPYSDEEVVEWQAHQLAWKPVKCACYRCSHVMISNG